MITLSINEQTVRYYQLCEDIEDCRDRRFYDQLHELFDEEIKEWIKQERLQKIAKIVYDRLVRLGHRPKPY